MLAVCCLPFALGIPALLWFRGDQIDLGFLVLAGALFAASILGLVVSVVGCSACVSRILGEL